VFQNAVRIRTPLSGGGTKRGAKGKRLKRPGDISLWGGGGGAPGQRRKGVRGEVRKGGKLLEPNEKGGKR